VVFTIRDITVAGMLVYDFNVEIINVALKSV